ncbi:MAG: hypothetical protein ABI162_08255 [Luteolibacter sp.]
MKNVRTAIAVVSGVLVPLGFVTVSGLTRIPIPTVLVGIIWGVAIAIPMIRRPESVTRKRVAWLVAPLIVALVAFVACYEPKGLIPTIVWALLFLSSQIAFLMASSKISNGCSRDR